MCGRFILIPKDELNRIIADVKANLKNQQHANVMAASQDVYPKATVPVIVPCDDNLDVAEMTWGYEFSWSKAPVFNTRADTALRTSTNGRPNVWSDSLKHRRCIVPSYGFYEPHKAETHPSPKTGKPIKQQYHFSLPDSDIVMMAGIWEDGHFSVITTEPNRWMADIHPRMPVVLLPDELETWLYGNFTNLFDRSELELIPGRVA